VGILDGSGDWTFRICRDPNAKNVGTERGNGNELSQTGMDSKGAEGRKTSVQRTFQDVIADDARCTVAAFWKAGRHVLGEGTSWQRSTGGLDYIFDRSRAGHIGTGFIKAPGASFGKWI